MKKIWLVAVVAVALVSGVMAASADGIVYDFQAVVKNTEATVFDGSKYGAPRQLYDTAFTANNVFKGYLIVEMCDECGEADNEVNTDDCWRPNLERNATVVVRRMGDYDGTVYAFWCDHSFLEVDAYNRNTGGGSECDDLAGHKNQGQSALKTAQVWIDIDDQLPSFFFGPTPDWNDQDGRWLVSAAAPYSLDQHIKAAGFGTVGSAQGGLDCIGQESGCYYLKTASGTLVGWFYYSPECGNYPIWGLCDLDICGTGVTYGFVAGVWSVRVNTRLSNSYTDEVDHASTALLMALGLIDKNGKPTGHELIDSICD